MDYYEIGDTIHESKIYVEARKIEGYRVIVKTGRHKAQSVTLIENAKAVIVKKLKYANKKSNERTSSTCPLARPRPPLPLHEHLSGKPARPDGIATIPEGPAHELQPRARAVDPSGAKARPSGCPTLLK